MANAIPERVSARQRRLAAEYASESAPLAVCNAAARRDAAAIRAKSNQLALAAMNAVAAALGGGPDPTKVDAKKDK